MISRQLIRLEVMHGFNELDRHYTLYIGRQLYTAAYSVFYISRFRANGSISSIE